MLNFEKYKDYLVKLEDTPKLERYTRALVECDTECEDCVFAPNRETAETCVGNFIRWLYREVGDGQLTVEEIIFLKMFSAGYIARIGKNVFISTGQMVINDERKITTGNFIKLNGIAPNLKFDGLTENKVYNIAEFNKVV